MKTPQSAFVGIDVGKKTLVIDAGNQWSVSNDRRGVAKLVQALLKGEQQPVRVILESSGGYERLILDALWEAGIEVCHVNPRRTKAFATSLGLEAKSDPIDARMLRLYGERMNPSPTPAPTAEVRALQPLIDRRLQLTEMITAEKNRSQMLGTSPYTKRSIARLIKLLRSELKGIDKEILSRINASENLRQKAAVLSMNKGVGPVLTMMLLGKMSELGTLNRAQAAALVGVAPFDNQSGTFTGTRSIRGGRKHVRTVLYMATVAAIRSNPKIKAHFVHLVKRGKPKMVALVACMRKMIITLNYHMREFHQLQRLPA